MLKQLRREVEGPSEPRGCCREVAAATTTVVQPPPFKVSLRGSLRVINLGKFATVQFQNVSAKRSKEN